MEDSFITPRTYDIRSDDWVGVGRTFTMTMLHILTAFDQTDTRAGFT